jgi:diamine N-acetyltransferase
MITLRPLRPEDIPTIKSWPTYPPVFAMLDYSLRDGGWLDEYFPKEGTEILVATDDNDPVGFAILTREPDGTGEFRIALHPLRLGKGLGKTIALLTLRHGFSDPALHRIRLIVRKNNPRAQRLYESLHFRIEGECTEKVHGETVAFRRMVIDREIFEGADML